VRTPNLAVIEGNNNENKYIVRQKTNSKYRTNLKNPVQEASEWIKCDDSRGELTSRGKGSRGTRSGEEGEDDRCEELHGMVLVVLVLNRNLKL
jgi:hypothetical protein